MKHKLFSWSLAAVTALSFSHGARATDGTITILGEITDTTCSIAVNNGSADATVTLPPVPTSALETAGQTAGTLPFSIVLSGCSGTTLGTASTWFEPGANVESANGRLNSTGTASNVQVRLLNRDLSPIVIGSGTSQNDVPVDISGGSGTLNYYAQYYATDATTAGSVSTSVQYTIAYQ